MAGEGDTWSNGVDSDWSLLLPVLHYSNGRHSSGQEQSPNAAGGGQSGSCDATGVEPVTMKFRMRQVINKFSEENISAKFLSYYL